MKGIFKGNEKRLTDEDINKELKTMADRELDKKEEQKLFNTGLSRKSLALFNFYRKVKPFVCDKCVKILRASVDLDGMKYLIPQTPVSKAKKYCEDNFCKKCNKEIK